MSYPAKHIDPIIGSQANDEAQAEGEVLEIDFRRRESLSEIFNAEIDAWARRALASNGFGDY